MSARVAALGLAALAIFIVYGSAGPWTAGESPTAALPGWSLPDITQNILLYIPFGIFGVWTVRATTATRSVQVVALCIVAFAYSASTELLQRQFGGRIASSLDVVANVAGSVCGIALAGPAERALGVAAAYGRRTGLLYARARFVLAVLLVSIVAIAWYPFDITLDVSTLGDRTRAVRYDAWLMPRPWELWVQGAVFCVVSLISASCLPRLRWWAAPVAALLTVVIAIVVDVGQLAMGSHPVGLAAFTSQAVGAAVGGASALAFAVVRGKA